jgi:hypothetical protein
VVAAAAATTAAWQVLLEASCCMAVFEHTTMLHVPRMLLRSMPNLALLCCMHKRRWLCLCWPCCGPGSMRRLCSLCSRWPGACSNRNVNKAQLHSDTCAVNPAHVLLRRYAYCPYSILYDDSTGHAM